MKLIVGLGNPGEKYKDNRHNVGYIVVDAVNSGDLPSGIIAKKTDCFMNESGESVKKLVNFYKITLDDLYIIHDDLDIPLGQYKIQKAIGPKVHNGVNSIEGVLNENGFWRVRTGVDNRDPENRVPGVDYVLKDFTEEERKILTDVIVKIVADLRGLNN
jgi:peptidyl-tRNA hydrolase, PTH1 family